MADRDDYFSIESAGQEFFGAWRSGHLEPQRAAVFFYGNLESQERATLPLKIDQNPPPQPANPRPKEKNMSNHSPAL